MHARPSQNLLLRHHSKSKLRGVPSESTSVRQAALWWAFAEVDRVIASRPSVSRKDPAKAVLFCSLRRAITVACTSYRVEISCKVGGR